MQLSNVSIRRFFFITVIFFTISNLFSKSFKSYKGLTYTDLPSTLQIIIGISIPDSSGGYSIGHHGLSLVREGKLYRIWFEREISRKIDSTGNHGVGKVIDEVIIDSFVDGDVIYLNNQYKLLQGDNSGLCGYGNDRDIEIIGYFNIKDAGNTDPNSVNKKIKRAWKANKKSNKLEEISTKGLVCDKPVSHDY